MTQSFSAIYDLADRAAANRWCVAGRFTTPIGGPSYEYVVGVELGNIALLNADCPTTRHRVLVSPEEFYRLCGEGRHFYVRVGMWDFEPANDPAADLIAYAHRNPAGVARELHRARERIRELEQRPVAATPQCHLCHTTPRDPVRNVTPVLHPCAKCERLVCEGCAEVEGEPGGNVAVCRACGEGR